MSKHHNILTTRTSFFISSEGKMTSVQEFIAVSLQMTLVFSEHDILQFCNDVHLLKYYPVKVPQNSFNFFSCSNQTDQQVSKF